MRPSSGKATVLPDKRRLRDLVSVGASIEADLQLLGMTSVSQLKGKSPRALYEKLCQKTGTSQDICVLDALEAAVAQAEHANLPHEQCCWWYYSRRRRASRAT